MPFSKFGCIEPHFDPPGPPHAFLGLHVQASLSFLLGSYTPSQETPEYHRGRKVTGRGMSACHFLVSQDKPAGTASGLS